MPRPWTPESIVDQSGRRVLVTGAGSGPARETALALASRGATLFLADRDLDALSDVVRHADAAGEQRPVPVPLDLADLDSVREAAAEVIDLCGGRLDLAVVDDGAGRGRAQTSDGFSVALAARLLGPYVLVSRLWEALATARGRMVTVVPPSYRLARDLSSPDDPDEDASRSARLLRRTALGAPAEAALASMLLALELDARIRTHDAGFKSLVAVAGLDPSDAVERTERVRRGRGPGILDAAMGALGRRGDVAHLPVLMAGTAELPSSTVVGLGGALGLGSEPQIVNPPRVARDRELRERVWALAREESGEDLW